MGKNVGKKLSLEESIHILNLSLERVTVRERAGRWYARGKIHEKGEPPKRREIAMNLSAREQNLAALKTRITHLDRELIMQTFRWEDWKQVSNPRSEKVIGEWVKELRAKRANSYSSWERDRGSYLDLLPQDKSLTCELICKFVEKRWEPASASREKARFAYGELLKFAEIECPVLKELCKGYTQSKVKPRQLPTDELIEEVYLQIKDERWRWLYAALAVYGLRPHEVFFLEPADPKHKSVKVTEGKTGSRIAYPIVSKSWEHLKPVEFPALLPLVRRKGKTHPALGKKVADWFYTQKMPFSAYYLRHAYAVRCLVKGLPTKFSAASMGHSEAVHREKYLAWIQQTSFDQIFEDYLKD